MSRREAKDGPCQMIPQGKAADQSRNKPCSEQAHSIAQWGELRPVTYTSQDRFPMVNLMSSNVLSVLL